MEESSSSPTNRPFRFSFKTEDKERLPYVIDIDTDVQSILIIIHSLLDLAKTDKNVKQIVDATCVAFVKHVLKPSSANSGSGNPFGAILGQFSSLSPRPPPGFTEMKVNDIASVTRAIEEMLSGKKGQGQGQDFDPEDLFKDDKAEPGKSSNDKNKDKDKNKLTD